MTFRGTVAADAFSGPLTGNADTATSASAIAAAGAFTSTEKTGTGASQNTAHGLGTAPRLVTVFVSDSGATGIYTLVPGTHTTTNCVFTVTTGVKYYVQAIK